MKTHPNSGHAKTVNDFETLENIAINLGTSYNPHNPKISVDALINLRTKAKDALTNLFSAETAYTGAVKKRKDAFVSINKLTTRINSAFKSTGYTPNEAESLASIIRKIQGRRASKKLTDEELKALSTEENEVTQHSASQRSFDLIVTNFERLINFLSDKSDYAPNEEDLQVASLNSLYETLYNINKTAADCDNKLANAREVRNILLYDPKDGVVAIANDVKNYIKSISGPNSLAYKKATALSFKQSI